MAAPDNARISPAKLALAVKRLRADRPDLDLIGSDPVAIVGMGCRFPGGANSPGEFWEALREGRDCVREIPSGRWKDAAALPPQLRMGGYLAEIDGFDASYFGISPREAQHIDPQHRLLLEVTWEALWDAGIEPASLAGTAAGVFVSIYNGDYGRLHFRDTSTLTAHSGMGAAHSVAVGRLSFLLNVKGPSLVIDTACSSSLVATHLACQSLRAGECGLAIVGASSLKLLSDEVLVFQKWGMLASDGKCKTFDAGADGFVPGEGCGVVVLKRLSDALADGNRVHAVIRGTAVNHDGRSTVLTAPNGLAQEAVLRAALKNAMLEPREVSYIETHGTGTSLGDPIEIEAVRSVYGDDGGGARPCVLGAVKTNFGHLEAAAGMAGLIKTALCLEHGEIPKNLHFHVLNKEISLDGSRLQVATEIVPWARSATPRVAGVSSFGLGGTNSHVVLEEAPLLPARGADASRRTIPLAARAWRRQRFWLTEPPSRKNELPAPAVSGPSVHPLLGRPVDSPFLKGRLFESDINTVAVPYLADHGLGERAIAPFAAFLEIAAKAIQQTNESDRIAMQNFAMHEPFFVSGDRCRLQTHVADGSVEIVSESGPDSKTPDSKTPDWKTKARASIGVSDPQVDPKIDSVDLARTRARCKQEISPRDIYTRLERTGLRYGPSFRTIQSVWSGNAESLAHLKVVEELRREAGQYGLHPTLLDGCLQSVMAAREDTGDVLFLPIGVDGFELRQTGFSEVWAYTKIVASSEKSISADIAIADSGGSIVARLTGFTAKRTDADSLERIGSGLRPDELTYEIAWRASPLTGTDMATSASGEKVRHGEHWLLVETETESCRDLADWLTAEGASCEIVRGLDSWQPALRKKMWTGIVFDARGGDGPEATSSWRIAEKNTVEFVFEFVKSLALFQYSPRLWVLTSRTAAVLPGDDVSVAHAPFWGLVRTLALEHPETSPVLVDIEPNATKDSGRKETAALLREEIGAGGTEQGASGTEQMVAFRGGRRYVARMVHVAPAADAVRSLQPDASGRLEDLRIEPGSRREPGPHEVEIQVAASGLNFRDVLTALGMLPARGPGLGAECSGTIARIGSNVSGWKLGDSVLAFAPFSLQTFVTVPAEFIARKHSGMTFVEAAGIPIAFLTAHYGLDRLGKLEAGQSVLIHAAAGGLGLAAVQLAMRAGARVFATAGNPEKREYLRRLGIEHVFDSRSLGFREGVLAATGGRGVDVVLNSLAGDFIGASFDSLATGGCFLEVGKRGIWSDEQVGSLGKSIRYFLFDLGDVAMANPGLIEEMLRGLVERFANGELKPLPTGLWAFEDATDAFRTMAQARHIGKIVLGIRGSKSSTSVRDLVSDGTVLVTGGLGALGTEAARWLAVNGAKSIVLAGRTAPKNGEYPIAAELRQRGVDVAIERVDVADSAALQGLLNKIRATRAPLRIVFHAAGIVRDSVLGNEFWRNYRDVTASKIDGAWNLHRLTRNDPIECMIFFSSAASMLGSPGQGSYAAGNAFLDALAHHRASRGLRTLSVNWGAWASAGMAARLTPEQSDRWARQGAHPMEPSFALAALDNAIESGRTQVAILDIDWERFFDNAPAQRDATFFRDILPRVAGRDSVDDRSETDSILKTVRSAPAAERKFIVAAHVRACARKVLGLEGSAQVPDNIPLQDIGLDSLMALEMRNELAQTLDVSLAAGLLFDYPAVDALTNHLLTVLNASKPPGTPPKTNDTAMESLTGLESLSEQEAERLLVEELNRLEKEKANV